MAARMVLSLWVIANMAGISSGILKTDNENSGKLRTLLNGAHATGARVFLTKAKGFEEATYRMRVCNAYAWPSELQMTHVDGSVQSPQEPLSYKECRDFSLALKSGSQLQFSAGDEFVGTFTVRDLPTSTGALLLLVPHRRNAKNAAAAFESHMFLQAESPQIALIDAYRGAENSTVLIGQSPNGKALELAAKETLSRMEELRYNSVSTVATGSYNVLLSRGGEEQVGSMTELDALAQGNYVVLRVGGGETSGKKWPEELIVFPQTSDAKSAAFRTLSGAWVTLLVAWCFALRLFAH